MKFFIADCFHRSEGPLGVIVQQMYEQLIVAPSVLSAVAKAEAELESIPGAYAKVYEPDEHEPMFYQALN